MIWLTYKGKLTIENGNWIFHFGKWNSGRIGVIEKIYAGSGKLHGKNYKAYLIVREVCKAERISQVELLDVFGLTDVDNPFENIKSVEGNYFFIETQSISWCVGLPISQRIKKLVKKEFNELSIDIILDKINNLGYESLTEIEKEFLKKNSE